ncbi:glutamine amidotransferase [Mycobacterium sp. 852002-51152_SCH6134967]|uniref:type 1 glutamine amidotransferase n=1 Tax=Mycobacterium sp. 852002-51152_SCH6134967 TaxID=1834096 RepID=UPI0008002FE2|nr:gamma-glutamyl-gamma-aminobutyrate hydrolase family protein [Mycobacterium sp. 852002-51152_SCH6134967]OBF94853.1 glutamine amidotransferase [Mycobacterium sp. 852002-51152_SCH6134967]
MGRVTARVLFLYNDPLATEALLGQAFVDEGFDVHTFEVVPHERAHSPAGDVTFPDPTQYDVLVPLGARWPVYDEALRRTWVGEEMAMMRRAAEAGIAILGICFGGQLLAQSLGGTVSRSPSPEIGWYDVESTDPELVPGGRWFQWHYDRWTLPPGATELARTANASQAFQLGRTLALQFHPEVDLELLDRWLADDDIGEVAALGLTPDELRSQTAAFARDAASQVRRLVHGFLTRVVGQPCPSS